MAVPAQPKVYHIVHVDRLASIVADGCLWCDAEIARRAPPGTTIGMSGIKQRRLAELALSSYPDLKVGGCDSPEFGSRPKSCVPNRLVHWAIVYVSPSCRMAGWMGHPEASPAKMIRCGDSVFRPAET